MIFNAGDGRRAAVAAVGLLLLAPLATRPAGAQGKPSQGQPAQGQALQAPSEPGTVDSILAAQWRREGLTPAPLCSDSEFLRRVTLDLAGRIPTASEVLAFRDSPNRTAKVDELLAGDAFPRFWSQVWTAQLNGYLDAFKSDREVLRQWLEQALKQKTPYNRIAYQLIAAEGSSISEGPVNFLLRHPQESVVKVSRIFLGVRLDCARCHDHPFDRWTQQDYEQMQRFFSATRRQEISEGNIRLTSAPPPNAADPPRFLTGARARTGRWREEFALMTTRSKPFARTFGNRMWYFFLGRGIVDPIDDFSQQNTPASPELLEHLADEARRTGFDVRAMCRLICNSRAYQLSSVVEAGGSSERRQRLFAVRAVKPLTVEQQLSSLSTALGTEISGRRRREFLLASVGASLDEDFSRTYEHRETSQALMSRLTRAAPAPATTVDELYLRILSRRPGEDERRMCAGHSADEITFALIHSHEFCFNH